MRHARVVDQDADTCVIAQSSFKGGQVGGACQVGLQHFDGHIACLAQARGQVIQARLVARNEDEVVATAGEALGVGGADAAGGTGDEDSRKRGHGFFLCISRSGGGANTAAITS
ncbi:hypothetical protein D3C85_872860 [compost metagenome]